MNEMPHSMQRATQLFAFFACTVTCLTSVVAEGVWAQTVTARAAHQVAPLKHSRHLGPHHVFGTILAINGNLLSVQRRNGKMLTVDATSVLASDDYSYPLFVGKTVAVDGAFSSKTTFLATHITAVTSLQSLEIDK